MQVNIAASRQNQGHRNHGRRIYNVIVDGAGAKLTSGRGGQPKVMSSCVFHNNLDSTDNHWV